MYLVLYFLPVLVAVRVMSVLSGGVVTVATHRG